MSEGSHWLASRKSQGGAVRAMDLGVLEPKFGTTPYTPIGRHLRRSSSPTWHSGCRSSMDSHEDVPAGILHRRSYCNNPVASELVKEIASLEFEIVNLERYLLTLYRNAYHRHIDDSPTSTESSISLPSCQLEGPVKDAQSQICVGLPDGQAAPQGLSADCSPRSSKPRKGPLRRGYSEKRMENKHQTDWNSTSHVRARSAATVSSVENSTKVSLSSASSHQTLADHLCPSLKEIVLQTPCKLSEDILRCISAVYHKLSDSVLPTELSSSPVSSLSSTSTFSPQDRSDNWSPRCYYDAPTSPCRLESPKDNSPYKDMAEISRISINKHRFQSAAALLEGYRILVQRLAAVNPNKFEHEEKLAFWINIHNAILMHAHIAYGLGNNHFKSTPSIFKKSYNIGGQNINAYEIRVSIFGFQPQRPEGGIRSLFTASKSASVHSKHDYALSHPEPVVHFALSSGAYSDPAVRIYTSKNVIEQLQHAKKEYIQSHFFIHRGTRIVLPSILQSYSKDASLELSTIMEMVHDCLLESQQKDFRACIKDKGIKCIQWSSYKSGFKYILHRDLDLNKQ